MFKPNTCTAINEICLNSVFFINLEHLSQPTLVLLFTLWKGKCWLKVRRELLVKIIKGWQTYTHNYAPKILLWKCSCHKNEKQNCKSLFYDNPDLKSVITMELKFIFFTLRCCFLRMTSLAVTPSTLWNFCETTRYFF